MKVWPLQALMNTTRQLPILTKVPTEDIFILPRMYHPSKSIDHLGDQASGAYIFRPKPGTTTTYVGIPANACNYTSDYKTVEGINGQQLPVPQSCQLIQVNDITENNFISLSKYLKRITYLLIFIAA